jgi:hypothetical protein
MSEADSTPRRRPPTIDLTAKEVETGTPEPVPQSDAGATGSAAGDAAPSGGSGGSFFGRMRPEPVGVAIGAVAAGAIAVGFWLAGFVPGHETIAPQNVATAPSPSATLSASSAKTGDTDEISARLDRIQQSLQAPQPDVALIGRMTTTEAQTKALSESLAALARRVDDVATASQSALAQAKAAAAAAEAAQNTVQAGVRRGDLDTLANRMTALEGAVKSLSAEAARRTSSSNADDRATRLTVAAEALRATVERGAPYQAELGAVTALGAEQSATAALEPFAAQGVPGAAQLGHELAALTPALYRATETEPNNDSFLARLENHAQKLVRITPLGTAAPAGDDPASVAARINAAAADGNLAAALADIAKLPDAARALTDAWVKKAQAREAAIAASQRIAADALAVLGKPVSQ